MKYPPNIFGWVVKRSNSPGLTLQKNSIFGRKKLLSFASKLARVRASDFIYFLKALPLLTVFAQIFPRKILADPFHHEIRAARLGWTVP